MHDAEMLHATSVAASGRALLIAGAAGAGKSSLALQLIAFGARLISDDRTELRAVDGTLVAHPAPNIAGKIEARGLGILSVPAAPPTPVAALVDLDQIETARLPPFRIRRMLDVDLPLLHKVDSPSFAAALWLYLHHERWAPHPPD
ncbi:HPr kinase/phosphorylase [Dinoroseobacter shibae DFL 12 = DSM 16493]|jgi:HPr kinase/phosphorylase|uniref:HPr kinase/phosphorylase n=3 Tax=Pseudomonadota TaxID=1224 RepID=A8LLE9_DINSH|nr:HPr kinase/phosphorylase [Dinoroseobacter shibae DFL 12 = DSM 16493]